MKTPDSHKPQTQDNDTNRTPGEIRSASRLAMAHSGVLKEHQLQNLREEFGDLLICPGYTSEFGKYCDEWGNVYIPGAATSHSESCQIFRGWRKRGENKERYSWWPQKIREAGLEPIRAIDIINGLDQQVWQEYARVYKRAVAARAQQRLRDRRLQFAMQVKGKKVQNEAAATLAGLRSRVPSKK